MVFLFVSLSFFVSLSPFKRRAFVLFFVVSLFSWRQRQGSSASSGNSEVEEGEDKREASVFDMEVARVVLK